MAGCTVTSWYICCLIWDCVPSALSMTLQSSQTNQAPVFLSLWAHLGDSLLQKSKRQHWSWVKSGPKTNEQIHPLPVGQRVNLIDRCDPAANSDKWLRACGLADCGSVKWALITAVLMLFVAPADCRWSIMEVSWLLVLFCCCWNASELLCSQRLSCACVRVCMRVCICMASPSPESSLS